MSTLDSVWAGYCPHGVIRAAIVARYADRKSLKDMGDLRVELIEGPVKMGSCAECEAKR